MKLIILLVLITTIFAQYQPYNQLAWWDLDDNEEYSKSSQKQIPFPQCLESGSNSNYFESSSLQALFDRTLRDEEYESKREGYENYKKKYNDVVDYDADDSANGYGSRKSRLPAAAAIKLTGQIMRILTCDLNGTDSTNINKFLHKFKVPGEFCTYFNHLNCDNKTDFRTPTGVCNNFKHRYQGSSQTAFGRILPPAYDDYISKPRRKSTRGGYLPPCRKVSLALGSKPIFDRTYNNFFVIFGQYIAHDIALATPVTDNYLTPVTSCKCDSKEDWNKCTVIDIPADDPFMGGQKCMAFPATAQAFGDELCSLGVKEQMNGNTHYLDLSGLYGSTLHTYNALRNPDGSLKSSKRAGMKYEYPPGQREGKSCVDSTYKNPCLAGGDSRLMENLLFTGIQSIFLRAHNRLVAQAPALFPDFSGIQIYEFAREYITGAFQTISFALWIPQLLGEEYGKKFLKEITTSPYNENVTGVVYNEVATAAFRCHTLVRDLFSRCTADGKRIDQLWLNDISHRSAFAYDTDNNGLDSIICGSLYDYGFAHDGNIAHQLHHRLFESTSSYGYLWRNDLAAINICRGREHGIAGYNSYREYCGLKKAYYFEDFGDTINYDGINTLKKLYKDPDDVDLFAALVLEDKYKDALVGRVSVCLLNKQFTDLCLGDRFCVGPQLGLDSHQFRKVGLYILLLIMCDTVDIQQVPFYPFSPPDDITNPLIDCSIFSSTPTIYLTTDGTMEFNSTALLTTVEAVLVANGYPTDIKSHF